MIDDVHLIGCDTGGFVCVVDIVSSKRGWRDI